jgi:hypothetical protein
MSTESQRSRSTASSRAEARRRARLAAQGQLPDDEGAAEAAAASLPRSTSGGILARMFPPAAPLPGKPDPMAGFSYDGPFASVVSSLWLLGRAPLVWLGFGVMWAIAYLATNALGGTLLGTIASLLTFGSLVASGWFGWRRPWAFGAAAGATGQFLYAAFLGVTAASGADIDGPGRTIPLGQAIASLVTSGIFMIAIGALAGFYGGYLRRRLAEPRPGASGARRR